MKLDLFLTKYVIIDSEVSKLLAFFSNDMQLYYMHILVVCIIVIITSKGFFFTFFNIHKKIVLDSRKFSASGFRWIYLFWDVLNKDWPFLKNVCLSVGLFVCMSRKFCGIYISRINEWKLMNLYIQLHFDIIWCWLDFYVYRSRRSDVIRIFWFL